METAKEEKQGQENGAEAASKEQGEEKQQPPESSTQDKTGAAATEADAQEKGEGEKPKDQVSS